MKKFLLAATALSLCLTMAGCNDDKKNNGQSSTFDQLTERITALEAENKDNKSKLDAQDQTIAGQSTTITALQTDRADKETTDKAEIAALQTRLDAAETQLADKLSIAAFDSRFEDLKKTLDALPTFTSTEELKNFTDKVASLRTDLDKAPKTDAVTALSDKLGDLENKLVDATEFKDIKDYVDRVKPSLDALLAAADPATLKTLKDDLAALRKDLGDRPALTADEIEDFTDRIAALERLIETKADMPPIAVAKAAAARLLPQHFAQFSFSIIPETAAKQDSYKVYGRAGAITIEGTSPAVILTGLTAYLKQVAGVSIGWPGDSLDLLPQTLPGPTAPIETAANGQHRFALNDTDDGYSDAYKSWPEWERKIDLLAMHGINQMFMPVGMEEVYRQTFKEFGYSDEEIRAWIPAPTHQPWWLLQNMAEIGGPMSLSLLEHRVDLGQKIVARLRELGMTPVFPGYFGTVPDKFKDKHPTAELIPQGMWVGNLRRPDWLDTRNKLYPKIAETFYKKQSGLFGDSTMYKMDLLHEGGTAGSVPVDPASRAVKEALLKAHPGAIWVLLGWFDNPLQATLRELQSNEVLIVDGVSDGDSKDNETKWLSRPYAFGTINNYGGRTAVGSATATWSTRFFNWRDKTGSALTGIAYLPEAVGRDNAGFEMFTELAWRDKSFDPADWFRKYATHRYGGIDTHATEAWQILGKTAYSMGYTSPQGSLFAERPTLANDSSDKYYNSTEFAKAIPNCFRSLRNCVNHRPIDTTWFTSHARYLTMRRDHYCQRSIPPIEQRTEQNSNH